ncbi:MAG: tRNA lysidine(34) synthetase TilS, partial [Gammaproteobacteria bacterium]|nr:tRNA lysidine(34) synthetase TilS [Gammaproteobacteria bacterium]
IPLKISYVKINIKPGESLEAVARQKRYGVFKKLLSKNDVLFTAHHQDDQAETVLLQLFRGAGLRGVSAMPVVSPLAKGYLVRPLLPFNRNFLLDYAKKNKLNWIEDPSNKDTRFDRNYLRQLIFPILKKRWPEITKTLTRFAAHCAQQENLLSKKAIEDIDAQEKNKLRHLILKHNLALPSEKVLDEILKISHAKSDKNPIVAWGNNQCRRYKNKLYFMKESSTSTTLSQKNLNWLKKHLPYDLDNKNITVKYRTGGEKIKLKKNQHTKTLKNLFQEWHVPTWERDKIPLIYYKNKLIAVTGYAIGAL